MATKKTTSVVKRQRKSLYDLLNTVAARIKAEPKSYNQSTFKAAEYEFGGEPGCGTICCIAGHMLAELVPYKTFAKAHYETIEYVSCRILRDAVGDDATSALVYKTELGVRKGTTAASRRRYAQAGVRHLRQWMKKHKVALKSARFPVKVHVRTDLETR